MRNGPFTFFFSIRYVMRAIVWMVLPRPISSARIPFRLLLNSETSHSRPCKKFVTRQYSVIQYKETSYWLDFYIPVSNSRSCLNPSPYICYPAWCFHGFSCSIQLISETAMGISFHMFSNYSLISSYRLWQQYSLISLL